MRDDQRIDAPFAVVVMGVSGSGKTTLAKQLSETFHWPFQEGDELHSSENVAKMSQGIALTDQERAPWLERCTRWLAEHQTGGIISCSALKRQYRDQLSAGNKVVFIYLTLPNSLLRQRLERRRFHYMPPSLLPSQLAILEPPTEAENAIVIDSSSAPEVVSAEAIAALRARIIAAQTSLSKG